MNRIQDSYGFKSAQSAYENASPYGNECDCETLYRCDACGEYSLESGTCKQADCVYAIKVDGNDPEDFRMVEVDRDDWTEGILTNRRCTLHNHMCDSRYCCD
jgi:hypothetical protein